VQDAKHTSTCIAIAHDERLTREHPGALTLCGRLDDDWPRCLLQSAAGVARPDRKVKMSGLLRNLNVAVQGRAVRVARHQIDGTIKGLATTGCGGCGRFP